MKLGVISLGCAKNRVDTEQMLRIMTDAGYELTGEPREADVLIVNTCGFIQPAKEESIDAILEMAEYKKTGACRALIVTGCLAQRYADDLLSDIPEIDALLGVSAYGDIARVAAEALAGKRPQHTDRRGLLECGRVLTTPNYSAYVRTGDGCDNRCAYCAIPLIRGGYRSRAQADILEEMRALAQNGAKEQILIAQDTTRYGRDLGNASLAGLIREASKTPGLDWLRVLYCYPDETDEALLREMAAHENVCKYLDLPLQHASPELLARMNRRGKIDDVAKLLQTARGMGFCLRTTFIVGFPGETERDFARLLDFTRAMRFDRMGAFAFSPEEDTPAYDMPGQLSDGEKQARLDALMALQQGISLERNRERIGAACRVLVTGKRGGLYVARSEWEAPDADGVFFVKSERPIAEGAFCEATVTEADAYDLTGVAVYA